MRLVYILLSPTFGMHQYTADLANRAVAENEVHLVTTEGIPADRYRKEIKIHHEARFSTTGLSLESLNPRAISSVKRRINEIKPDVVHFTGPHMWNLYLLGWLRHKVRAAIHTIHDLDAHEGAPFGRLLSLWNRTVLNLSSHIVVHNKKYLSSLIARGFDESDITWLPLLHTFFSHTKAAALVSNCEQASYNGHVTHQRFALFFGRIEVYKGIDILLESVELLNEEFSVNNKPPIRLVIAGKGKLPHKWTGSLPDNVEWRNRFISDDEAIDLFRRCNLVILPYTGATQSAIVAAAYYFCKPVLVTNSGALEEYVIPCQTGFVVQQGDSRAMANALAEAFATSSNLSVMGLSGRRWYDQQRDLETRELLRLYRSICQDNLFSISERGF